MDEEDAGERFSKSFLWGIGLAQAATTSCIRSAAGNIQARQALPRVLDRGTKMAGIISRDRGRSGGGLETPK